MRFEKEKDNPHRVVSRPDATEAEGHLPGDLALVADQLSDDAAYVARRHPADPRTAALLKRVATVDWADAAGQTWSSRSGGFQWWRTAAAVLLIATVGWVSGVLTSHWLRADSVSVAVRQDDASGQTVPLTSHAVDRASSERVVVPVEYIQSLPETEREALLDIMQDNPGAAISFTLAQTP